ncbi:hypothetical protein A9J31_13045 [Acinetobacter gandensis]|uniref:Uncharacterized protein n=2 Tax=Acinetobacter gandensis TaxID=1443941 RepID=A0A1A7RCE9_9GAMM|nr:hypothetical protein A9J31_13045 [Acinetobacter gandensis]
MRFIYSLFSALMFSSTMSTTTFASIAHYDYVTSIKVNDVDLASPLPAAKANALISKNPVKLKYEYSECTGNTEFQVSSKGKFLKFEIYAEDNPQIKNDSFYKNKNSFAQLGQTKGAVWMEWDNATQIRDKIQIGQKNLTSQYNFQQFKKDFPKSAKSASQNEVAYVILLSPAHAKSVLKEPQNYDLPYIGNLAFNFKNGKLTAFSVNQGIAC